MLLAGVCAGAAMSSVFWFWAVGRFLREARELREAQAKLNQELKAALAAARKGTNEDTRKEG